MLYALHVDQNCPASGPVFRGRQGGPLQLSTLARWFGHWLQAADLSAAGYTLHSLRRFAAKRWLDSGLNIRHVQMLLGHEDLKTTILYLNYDLDEIQRAAAQVSFGLTSCLNRDR
jgi:integrase